MFVVNNSPRPVTTAVSPKEVKQTASEPAQVTNSAPAPFEESRFEPAAPAGLSARLTGASGYYPTNAELLRPTSAAVVNITNGERQGLNPAQMSNEQGIAFVNERLAAMGYSGPGSVANNTSPTTGPFRIDYGNDDRRHWDVDGMNVGLTLQLYANNPPEVADRMLAANLQHARTSRPSWEAEGEPQIPRTLVARPGQQPSRPSGQAFAPMRILPGMDGGAALRQAQPAAPRPSESNRFVPSLEELNRPTSATSLNILTGERTGLNPAQMSDERGVEFLRERLAALGISGGDASNRTAPTTGPFGIDYGTDDRRHWDLAGMNVGLTLQLYARNPPEVADRMLADMVRQAGH